MKPKPVPVGPRHRRGRFRLWSSYGLRWRGCPDRNYPAAAAEPPTDQRANRSPRWNAPPAEKSADPRVNRSFRWNDPTVANPQVGRAGGLTRAQSWRANGGRW